MATVEFGRSLGSILCPVISILYVADLRSELQCDCYQYADDMTFYFHSKPCDLNSSADHINKALTSLRDYSKNCNMALNSSKTNWMLISTPQMARYHSLEERKLPIACGDTPLKRISCTKLLGVHVDQHLTSKTLVNKWLYDEILPEYLKLNVHKISAYSLRSSFAPVLPIPRESGTQ